MNLDWVDREFFSCASAFWPWATGLLANATLLLAGILTAESIVGRRRAALRHLLGSAGLACLILLPALNLSMSAGAWARASWSAMPRVFAPLATAIPFRAGAVRLLLTVWAAGAALMLARLGADLLLLGWHARRGAVPVPSRWDRRVARRARRLGIRRPVRVLYTAALDIPCTWGLVRPVILLPRRAVAWGDERTEVVLLHELGHVRRNDPLVTILSRVAGALFWFHPLAFWVERRMREDAERACDNLVIEQGIAPRRYARHLLEIIRDARPRVPSIASAMAGASHLERRIAALVDGRRTTSRLGRVAILLALLLLVVPTLVLAGVSVPGMLVAQPGQDGPDCSGEPGFAPDDLQSREPEPFTVDESLLESE